MNVTFSENAIPDVIKRARGGVIAISRRSLPVCIGVLADDEESARREFARLVSRWWEARNDELAASSCDAERQITSS